jgi:hypothetical protein
MALNLVPGAYSQRNPLGGSVNVAIPLVVPALVGKTRGANTAVTAEEVTRGAVNTADALTYYQRGR